MTLALKVPLYAERTLTMIIFALCERGGRVYYVHITVSIITAVPLSNTQYLTRCCGPEACEAWLAVLVVWVASVAGEAERGREREGRRGEGEEGRVGD